MSTEERFRSASPVNAAHLHDPAVVRRLRSTVGIGAIAVDLCDALLTALARLECAEADADRLASALARLAQNAIPPELRAHEAAVAERSEP